MNEPPDRRDDVRGLTNMAHLPSCDYPRLCLYRPCDLSCASTAYASIPRIGLTMRMLCRGEVVVTAPA